MGGRVNLGILWLFRETILLANLPKTARQKRTLLSREMTH
jgi:hypothetical protein